jgi:endonuclease/exonuclease/phosphatase family metal-dependent hydrolase
MALRVLTWNLMHGRAVPPARRELFEEFAGALGGWEWDVALLQEVPPWWPSALGARLDVDWRLVLTSRNALLALRRAIATRWPDAAKSNGGGCNAILAREREIAEHRTQRLCRLPERRWVHGVRLGDPDGLWACNLHTASDASQGRRAAEVALGWAGGLPALLGGDFNVAELSLPGFVQVGGHESDHVLVRGLAGEGPFEVLDRGRLSDHAPLLASVIDLAAYRGQNRSRLA